MAFRIRGLDPAPFQHLFGLTAEELAIYGAIRYTVEERHSAPDRIELRDAEPGETVLLINHEYLSGDTPYRGRHAIYVREGAEHAFDEVDDVPDAMRRRLISLRAFDATGMMIDADVVEGAELETLIDRLFSDRHVAFLQAHHARRGCYAALIERA